MTTVTNKNGIEFDIDAIATDLNGKMDVDGVNATSLSNIFFTLFCPDWANGINQTIGQENTIPNAGYLYIKIGVSGNNSSTLTINNTTISLVGAYNEGSGQNWSSYLIPVAKNDVYSISNGDVSNLIFFPMRGVSNN